MNHRMGTPYPELGTLFHPVEAQPGSSGFFRQSRGEHDPQLFYEGTDRVRTDVRLGVLKLLYDFWQKLYKAPESWSTVWIAGSALTKQWSRDADGSGGDLDVLLGVRLSEFLRLHPGFRGFSEQDIASHMNTELREGLWPHTQEWRGFDVTFYVNPRTGDDIREINPYAAYNLTTDEWTVVPPEFGEDWGPESIAQSWWNAVNADLATAEGLVERYNRVIRSVDAAPPGPRRVNLMREVELVVDQVAALYKKIHGERSYAFQGFAGVPGQGYADFYNFRWQMFKRAGMASTLNSIYRLRRNADRQRAEARYGAPISANVLTPSNLLDL